MMLYVVLATLAVWSYFAVRQLNGRRLHAIHQDNQAQYSLRY